MHKHSSMVEVYSKIKPDTFTLQFQTVLTAYYEDIKRVVRAAEPAPSPRWSRATSRTGLRQTPTPLLPPQLTTTTTPMQPTPPPRRTWAQQPHPAGRSLHWPPALGAGAGAARGGWEGVVKGLLARPKADAD
jgi:hypothetical protein